MVISFLKTEDMKKTYINPEMEVVKVAVQQLVCTSLSVLDGEVVNPLAPDFQPEDLDGMFTTEDLDGFFGM